MKKLFTLITIFLFSGYLSAQDIWPPSNLTADGGLGIIHLQWDAPVDPNALFEGFESGDFPADWQVVDVDGDAFNWIVWDQFVHSGAYSAASFSFDNSSFSALTPDNWMITPPATMGPGGELSFWVGASDANWYWEEFKVFISTTGNTPADFTDPAVMDVVLDSTAAGAFVNYTFDLSAYDGQTIWMAFVHNGSTDVFNITFDDIMVTGAVTGPWAVTFEDPNDIDRMSYYATTDNQIIPIKIGENDSPQLIKEKVDKFFAIQNNRPKTNSDKAPDGYNVYRDGSLIGSTGDLFYDDDAMTYGEPHDYYVTAVYGTTESEPTNVATATAVDPANIIACYDFEDGIAPSNFTVVNNNADGYTWDIYSDGNNGSTYSWAIRWNSSLDMDDYTFIGPFTFDETAYYALEFFQKVRSATYPENLAGGIYSAADPGTLVSPLFDLIDLSNTEWLPYQFVFSVPSTGDYYIGFWGHSAANMWRLYLDDICIKISDQIPVELTSFTANVVNNEVVLNWQTATETNNSGFAIERSNDKENFVEIAFVDGHGTTSEKSSYNYVDANAPSGNVYYRLKQIDFDGSYSYSPVVEIEVSTPKEFALAQNYPNPFNPSTEISFALPVDSKVTLTLYNSLGQVVATIVKNNFSSGVHKVRFNANGLSTGVYIYTINAQGVDGTNFISSRKMILMK